MLETTFYTIADRSLTLIGDFHAAPYSNQKAWDYALHGFSRRLMTLARCIHNAFEILPVDLATFPSQDQLSDAAINVQAFVFNIFGCLDNLAWIWVEQKAITDKKGKLLPDAWVGLSKGNQHVRASFSPDFQNYLQTRDDWFDYLADFRHSLAHRIPLYIPPYVVSEANKAAFQAYNELMNEAIVRRDYATYDRLSAEQDSLGVFRPWMSHSLEADGTVMLHAQLLADFATIEEIAQKFLEELHR